MTQIINKFLAFISKFNKSIDANAVIGKGVVISEQSFIDRNCRIGKHTYIGKNCNLTKVDVGSYCSIANNVSIGQGEHHLDRVSTSSLFYNNSYDELTIEPCIIENDVWIGADSLILRGVRVGNSAVIGANSVVTKDVPPFAVVVGSPAKVLRYRVDTDKADEILATHWWEKDIDEAKSIIKGLSK